MKVKILASILLTLSLISVGAHAMPKTEVDPPCNVSDKSGTPLNLRALPNGKIIATLKDGTEIT